MAVAAGGGRRWRPWRALRERSDIDFALVDLPPGAPDAVLARRGPDTVILIDRALPPAERLAALAHELVHLERGGSGHIVGAPPQLQALIGREERRVDRIVAGRLVPVHELATAIRRRCEITGGVTAAELAEDLEVAEHVAACALEQWMKRPA